MRKLVDHKAGALLFLIACLLACFVFCIAHSNYKNKKISRLRSPCSEINHHLKETTNFEILKQKKIILLGDSRVAQWPVSLLSDLNALEILNLGRKGYTSHETLCLVRILSEQLQSKKIVLQVGINDLVATSMMGNMNNEQRVIHESQIVKNIQDIADELSGSNQLFVTSIIPPIDEDLIRSLVWGSNIEASALKTSEQIKTITNIGYVDLTPIFYDTKKDAWRADLANDALHWNLSAYEQLTQLLKDRVFKE